MSNEKKPALRFKGFTDDWEQRKLGEVSESYSGGTPSVGVKEYYGGQIPFIRSAEINSEITELFLTEEGLKNSSARLVAVGDILYALYGATSGEVGRARLKGAINQAILAIKPHTDYDSEYLAQWLRKSKHSIIETYLQGGQGNLSGTIVKELSVDFPSLKEQQAIGDFFSQLDNLITLHQRKYNQLTKIKKSMLEKMFPHEGQAVPEIRFAGFTEPWEQRKLDDMCTIITKQTGFDYSATIKPALVTAKEQDTYSFIQNKDFEGTNINLDTDFYIPISVAEKYPKITIDQPSLLISISGRIGNVGLYSLDSNAFIGGAVGICKLKNIEDGKTALYELLSPAGQKYFSSLIKASSHANITVEDIRNIETILPKDEDEKEKLNRYFENLDHLITLHQRQLDQLKNIKKSMLEKMFV